MPFGPEMCVTTKLGTTLHMGGAPELVLHQISRERDNQEPLLLGKGKGADWLLRNEHGRPVGHISLMSLLRTWEVNVLIYKQLGRHTETNRGRGYGGAAIKGLVCTAFSPQF